MLHLQLIFVFASLVVVVYSNELHHPRFRRETYGCSGNDKHANAWNTGRSGEMRLSLPAKSTIVIELSKPVAQVQFYCLTLVSNTATRYTFKMKSWCPSTDCVATLRYTLQYGSARAEFRSVMLNGVEKCVNASVTTTSVTTSATTTNNPTTTTNNPTMTTNNPTTTTNIPTTATKNPTTSVLNGKSCSPYHTVYLETNSEKGIFQIPIKNGISTWRILVGLTYPITDMYLDKATKNSQSSENTLFEFKNYEYDGNLKSNSILSLNYNFYYQWNSPRKPEISSVKFITNKGEEFFCSYVDGIDKTASTTTTETVVTSTVTSSITTTSTTEGNTETPSSTTTYSTTNTGSTSQPQCTPRFNYREVLHSSILFYEAQRSGKLPANNRISWRKSSTENDGSACGKNLAGGYFDAGDYVKFNFPQASAMTMLAWGMVEFSEGYKFAGEYKYGLDTLKWGMDYLMKCHTSPNELYAQVGNGYTDHGQWGRPEDITINRPCYKIDVNKPGSDLAGEVAASLAASSIVFRAAGETYRKYSDELLQHAKELYEFANKYRAQYSDSIPELKAFYNSFNGFDDELALAATWLYKATNNNKYLSDAETHWDNMQHLHYSNELSWDNKARAVAILLAKVTNKANYISNAEDFCSVAKNKAPRIPSGMIFIQPYGSNRHAANIAFACLVVSKQSATSDYTEFSRQQIHIMLGENNQKFSFVVGFGSKYPLQPHHRSSSCPVSGSCNFGNFNAPGPNPHILTGALVGGPESRSGSYTDKRSNFITNEVAIDYNAGFQSAIAGLLESQINGLC